MSITRSDDLITTAEAAALLQPFFGKISAHYLLVDMRRTVPVRTRWPFPPPKPIKKGRKVFYRRRDILTRVAALEAKRRPASAGLSVAGCVPVKKIPLRKAGAAIMVNTPRGDFRLNLDQALELVEDLKDALATH